MGLGKYFDLFVKVGGSALEEYHHDGQIYIESKINTKWTYTVKTTEPEVQEWPVTPYKIEVNPKCSGVAWYELYIDGIYIWNKPLKFGKCWTVDGYTDGEGVHRELLFTLPRFSESEKDRCEKARRKKLGTIELRCLEAFHKGEVTKTVQDRFRDFSNNMGDSSSAGFKHATKQDCGSKGLATTASGKELYRYVGTNRTKYTRMTRYSRGRLLDTITLNYRMRPILVEMGLIQDENLKPKSERTTPSKAQSKKIKQEVDANVEFQSAVDQTMEQFSTLSTGVPLVHIKREMIEQFENRVDAEGKSYQVLVRKEVQPKERAIVIDEDIALIEELDDSVTYVGDDSCLIIDVPPKEFPVHCLDDSIM
ncbi:uncharacterized protein LOC141899998 [Tubulanus polymorphus]|uniref:uncharacterized protein LOC141899998 n=1 Tax=Tubulanus polymorphus TaxID=672921 RepID=UPI003DA5CB1D